MPAISASAAACWSGVAASASSSRSSWFSNVYGGMSWEADDGEEKKPKKREQKFGVIYYS